MYTIENVVNSVTRQNKPLSILLFTDAYDDSISLLCETGHNFYLVCEANNVWQWDIPARPPNLTVATTMNSLNKRSFDFSIVWGRASNFDKGYNISSAGHIPVIVIDMASSFSKLPMPFFTSATIDHPEAMFQRSGIVSVGITEIITKSWYSNYTKFSTTISLPSRPFNTTSKDKILIDRTLPQEYLNKVPIDISNFTFDPQEAQLYLHLWQTVTPLMLNCMASKVPVVTFNSIEFKDIIDNKACVLIENIGDVANPTFVTEIESFISNANIIDNAYTYTLQQNTIENFVQQWNRVLDYASNHFYLRG